jgi:hypothetical protein
MQFRLDYISQFDIISTSQYDRLFHVKPQAQEEGF